MAAPRSSQAQTRTTGSSTWSSPPPSARLPGWVTSCSSRTARTSTAVTSAPDGDGSSRCGPRRGRRSRATLTGSSVARSPVAVGRSTPAPGESSSRECPERVGVRTRSRPRPGGLESSSGETAQDSPESPTATGCGHRDGSTIMGASSLRRSPRSWARPAKMPPRRVLPAAAAVVDRRRPAKELVTRLRAARRRRCSGAVARMNGSDSSKSSNTLSSNSSPRTPSISLRSFGSNIITVPGHLNCHVLLDVGGWVGDDAQRLHGGVLGAGDREDAGGEDLVDVRADSHGLPRRTTARRRTPRRNPRPRPRRAPPRSAALPRLGEDGEGDSVPSTAIRSASLVGGPCRRSVFASRTVIAPRGRFVSVPSEAGWRAVRGRPSGTPFRTRISRATCRRGLQRGAGRGVR